MPRRKSSPTEPRSNLAHTRLRERISQKQLAEWVGVSLRQYRRLEANADDTEIVRPPLAFFVNCSLALGVPFDDVAPPDWQETWTDLNGERPIPPFDYERDEARQAWPE